MANITKSVADSAGMVPEVWAQRGLEVLRSNIVAARLVAKDSDYGSFRVGDTLHLAYPGTFAANNKAANTGVTLQVPTGADTTVVLNKHREVSFIVEDAAAAVAQPETMDRYISAAVVAIAEAIEGDILAEYANISESIGTSGTDLDYATILLARKTLTDAKAPMGNRSIILSTKDELALLSDSDLQAYFANQGRPVQEGSIGRLGGFDLFPSQMVPVVAGTPDSTKNIAFHRDAIVLAMRSLPEPPANSGATAAVVRDAESGLLMRAVMAYNASHLGIQVTLDVLYGVKVVRDALACVVLS
jgi:hypothetical protein